MAHDAGAAQVIAHHPTIGYFRSIAVACMGSDRGIHMCTPPTQFVAHLSRRLGERTSRIAVTLGRAITGTVTQPQCQSIRSWSGSRRRLTPDQASAG
jgi:hypothetical protein